MRQLVLKKTLVLMLLVTMASVAGLRNAYGGFKFKLAFLSEKGTFSGEDKATYRWADKNYDVTLLFPDGTGKFKDDKNQVHQLSEFAVLWWHEGDVIDMPPDFVANKTMDAIKAYMEAGGSLLLHFSASSASLWLFSFYTTAFHIWDTPQTSWR